MLHIPHLNAGDRLISWHPPPPPPKINVISYCWKLLKDYKGLRGGMGVALMITSLRLLKNIDANAAMSNMC